MFKQKFENFAPMPPDHVWKGIQAGIAAPVAPSFFAQNWKIITAAAVVVALITAGIVVLSPGSSPDGNVVKTNSTESNINNVDQEIDAVDKAGDPQQINIDKSNSTEIPESDEIVNTETKVLEPSQFDDESIKSNKVVITGNTENSRNGNQNSSTYQNTGKKEILAANENYFIESQNKNISLYQGLSGFTIPSIGLPTYSFNSNYQPQIILPAIDASALTASGLNKKKGGWSIGLYFSPEMMLNNFDSLELMANYSLGIEPTYYVNKHLFIRFGLGASYSRDRGYVALDYMSNDLLGTYDYVYDVTFDSVDGVVVPTYHTKTEEVWDTVRHLEVNSLTNKYVYLQAPLLFGYYNTTNRLNWYFYGGPAFNMMVSKQIDQPLENLDYIEVNEVDNDLPERSPYYFQLWVGAGIEYKATQKLGLALEPNYRYYFKNVYKDSPYSKSGLSGFTLRFGLTYTIQ